MTFGVSMRICCGVLFLVLGVSALLSFLSGSSGVVAGALAAFGAIVALIFAVWVTVAVEMPSRRFEREVKTFADGNRQLKYRFAESGDTYDALRRALNAFLEQQAAAIESLAHTTTQIAAASAELAASSTKISASAHAQADRATEVAAAMEEMTATVSEVAQNATQVAEQAKVGTGLANNGADVVRRTIESMEVIANSVKASAATVEELGKRSAEIGQIIGVISDIADQTNLLSLNAAIEAARAGEHGRGFAVVADEVRKLAEKTSQATNEVRHTIGSTQAETQDAVESMRSGNSDVEVGVKLASQAERSLSDIVASYISVNDMVHQIATAAEEQSSTSGEISRHIESIASSSKEVTDGIRRIADASQELARASREMKNMLQNLGV